MNLTEALKQWAIANLGVEKDASDAEFKKAIAGALVEEKLSADEYAKLATSEPDVKAELAEMMAAANAPVVEALKGLSESVAAGQKKADPPKEPEKEPEKKTDPDEKEAQAAFLAVVKETARAEAEKMLADERRDTDPGKSLTFMAAAAAKGMPRVVEAAEQYSDTRTALICPVKRANGRAHPNGGRQATYIGQPLDTQSRRDLAVIGAYARWQRYAEYSGGDGLTRLSEHDRQLVQYALHKMSWVGCVGGEDGIPVGNRLLSDPERKALLDDTTSGGSYAVPQVFDEALITTPLLHGELFPEVEVVNLARGSSVDGATWTDPSWTWGSSEGSAFNVISTASLIGNFDTTIFPAVAAIELGMDWESDTPINFGAHIVARLGEKLKETLDEQIAIGDGTQEPTGIFVASGVTSVNATNGTSGPLTAGDFEALIFGLTKAMRESSPANNVFVMRDLLYRKARAIYVGATDERRIFGMDHAAYTIFDYPVKIQESISLGSIAFWQGRRYRMFRRMGMQVRTVTEGQTLALKNTRLLVFRARFGGQPTLGSSIATMTDAPTSVV